MNGWEACKLAINEPGLVVNDGNLSYKYCNEQAIWLTKDPIDGWGIGYSPQFETNLIWRVVKPEPKMITWYKITVLWNAKKKAPDSGPSIFFKSKEKALKAVKVWSDCEVRALEWKEIQAPESFEDCE